MAHKYGVAGVVGLSVQSGDLINPSKMPGTQDAGLMLEINQSPSEAGGNIPASTAASSTNLAPSHPEEEEVRHLKIGGCFFVVKHARGRLSSTPGEVVVSRVYTARELMP